MNNNKIISLKNFGMLRSCDVAELLVMTDTSSEATESEVKFIETREDYSSSLPSDGEVEDCRIIRVEPQQLNHDNTSTDSDVECTGVELPEPLDEPTPKRQRKTLMDYFRKDETPSQPRETYPQFLQRYEPTDVLCRSTRGKKSVTHGRNNLQLVFLMLDVGMEILPKAVKKNVDHTELTASVRK